MALKANELVTGQVRLSFVHLFQAYAFQEGQEAKYSTTILLPKTDTATKQRIDAAIAEATKQGVSKTWGGQKPAKMPIPVYDGDGVRPSDGEAFGPECKGCWVFTASSKQPVEIVDTAGNPIINETEVYSGMFARVCVSFFPYAFGGKKKGIGCGLGPVQKVKDGEPLANRTRAADAFGAPQAQTNDNTDTSWM